MRAHFARDIDHSELLVLLRSGAHQFLRNLLPVSDSGDALSERQLILTSSTITKSTLGWIRAALQKDLSGVCWSQVKVHGLLTDSQPSAGQHRAHKDPSDLFPFALHGLNKEQLPEHVLILDHHTGRWTPRCMACCVPVGFNMATGEAGRKAQSRPARELLPDLLARLSLMKFIAFFEPSSAPAVTSKGEVRCTTWLRPRPPT